ncbi:MAG: pyridoxal phosphate-dependent aminotransferase [Candidatus Eremiobacteraeota bacterium]|nr:pyridoxal phosphate-dependent aminotransferase [Candidatus Eremiobacteraeota bacterium]
MLCSPCNPTGRVIGTESVRRIAVDLARRSGPPIYVLHDEIYREQRYVDDLGAFGNVYPWTIAVNSLSKSNALTGLRLGWAIGPAEVMPAIVKMHGWTTSCASTFAQRVAIEIFRTGALPAQREWYAAQREAVVELAREARFDFVVPEGAFYLCLNVHAADSLAFCHDLIDEHDVIAVPGSVFAASMEGWIRTSFVSPLDQISEGYRRIASLAALVAPA